VWRIRWVPVRSDLAWLGPRVEKGNAETETFEHKTFQMSAKEKSLKTGGKIKSKSGSSCIAS
jgi:hypothetical protein